MRMSMAHARRLAERTGRRLPITAAGTPMSDGRSELEAEFAHWFRLYRPDGVPDYMTEYPFAAGANRRYRLDVAWPDLKLAIEIEGHGHQMSRYATDVEKYNLLAAQGWTLLRCTRPMLREHTQAFMLLVAQTYRRLLDAHATQGR